MSVAQWVLFGLAVWLAVAVVLGLLVARFLRAVGEQDKPEHSPECAETPSDDGSDDGSDDAVPPSREGDHDEIARARRLRRRSG